MTVCTFVCVCGISLFPQNKESVLFLVRTKYPIVLLHTCRTKSYLHTWVVRAISATKFDYFFVGSFNLEFESGMELHVRQQKEGARGAPWVLVSSEFWRSSREQVFTHKERCTLLIKASMYCHSIAKTTSIHASRWHRLTDMNNNALLGTP